MHRVNDRRSMKVVFCSHCILNQNAKLEGIAGWPGMIGEVVEVIARSGAGLAQMACPEMLYEGIGRFDKSVEQYRCAAFEALCERLAEETVAQIANYRQWGYQVLAVLAIDGSPSCGFNLTQSAPEWRGLVAGQSWAPVRYIPEPGVYMATLKRRLEAAGLAVPIIGIPEIPALGSLDEALKALEACLLAAEAPA